MPAVLPVHPTARDPRTGQPLLALALLPSGRVMWPIAGGSGEGEGGGGGEGGTGGGQGDAAGSAGSAGGQGGDGKPDTGGAGAGGSEGDSGDDLGFPANTPVAQMKPEQQAAYWKHQARKHENTAKARGDYDQIRAERDALRQQTMTEQEKAVEEAKTAAAAEARQALIPQLVGAEFRAAAAGRQVNGKPLDVDAILEDLDTSKFVAADGTVDRAKVVAKIDALAPKSTGSGFPDLGQGRRNGGPSTARDAGREEARRRFGEPAAATK